MGSLANLLQQIYDSGVGTAIREGDYAFPWIECFHVLALTIVFGSIAVVDFRLIGFASHRKSTRLLIKEFLPYTWVAFIGAVISGSLLFSSNAIKYAGNPLFIAKMIFLVAAGINMAIFHVSAYRNIAEWDEDSKPPMAARVAGALSLTLWMIVIVLGRWVGFV